MRCACKRRKEKLACAEVQRLLQAATGSAAYDAGTSLRLLPCDAACAKAAAATAASGAAEPAAAKAGSTARWEQEQEQAQQGGQQEQRGQRKLSKEEKLRLAEEKRREKEAAARRKQIMQVRRAECCWGVGRWIGDAQLLRDPPLAPLSSQCFQQSGLACSLP